MSANTERSPENACKPSASGDLSSFLPAENLAPAHASLAPAENLTPADDSPTPDAILTTLSTLPVGARLILRCRKDWRVACVMCVEPDRIVLSVGSPTGRTYRVRRPHDSPLSFDGPLPILGDGLRWRTGLARYDARW
ncbi:MAG TPA: hypothetical protein VNA19_15830 [Pyrinomonadaceae bacterium]|nr:hypothetical protein [Pyrinomonadaceae bacterium]